MDVSDVIEKDGYFLLQNGFIPFTVGDDVGFRRGSLEYLVTKDPYLHVYSCIHFGEVEIHRNVTQIAWKNHTLLQESAVGFFRICSRLESILGKIGSDWRFIKGESIMYWAIDNNFQLEILPRPAPLTMKCVTAPHIWSAEFIPSGEIARFRGIVKVGNMMENEFGNTFLNFRLDKKFYSDSFKLWDDVRDLLLNILKERAGEVDFSQK